MNLETKITIYKFTPQVFTLTPYFFIRKFGIFIPSCPHCMYNGFIMNDLYDYSKKNCSHLYSHALTTF